MRCQKLDRLDDAFLYKESIDLSTYKRQRDRLREELTLIEIDRYGSKLEEFDVEGILNFASGCYRVLRTSGYRRRWSNGSGSNKFLSRRNCVRRKNALLEPRNRTSLQLLAGNRDRK